MKYYFGYINYFGRPAPVAWVEDGGITIGNNIAYIGSRYELTQQEFETGYLDNLSKKYPFKGFDDASPTAIPN